MSLYLFLNIAAVIFPLAFSFHKKINFYRELKYYIPAMLITALCFIYQDIKFTQIGVWGFNGQYLQGIFLFGIPLEEHLFFICIPYACVFTWHVLKQNAASFKLNAVAEKYISLGLALFCLSVALVNYEKIYTSSTFLLSAFTLIISHYAFKPVLQSFLPAFIILLIPFMIINGTLTGGFGQEVVWYNEKEIIGLRIISIPVEDVFYGMNLLLWNINIMNWLKRSTVFRRTGVI